MYSFAGPGGLQAPRLQVWVRPPVQHFRAIQQNARLESTVDYGSVSKHRGNYLRAPVCISKLTLGNSAKERSITFWARGFCLFLTWFGRLDFFIRPGYRRVCLRELRLSPVTYPAWFLSLPMNLLAILASRAPGSEPVEPDSGSS